MGTGILVFTCHAGAPMSRAAVTAAHALADEGLAALPCFLPAITGYPKKIDRFNAADGILVIDGCAGCCMKKLLKSLGVPVHAHINVFETFGGSPDRDKVVKLARETALALKNKPEETEWSLCPLSRAPRSAAFRCPGCSSAAIGFWDTAIPDRPLTA